MNIGKAAISVFLICLLAFSMLAVFSILKKDQSPDIFYKNDTTLNRSATLTESVLESGTAFITPTTLIVSVLFFMAAVLIFNRHW